jgi:hypothetical protein
MRSRQPAGSTTTIARDHFPTIVEQDRRVRFPAAIAIHPDHGKAYDRVFRIPSRMTVAGVKLCVRRDPCSVLVFRGVDVILQMFHPPTLVPGQLKSPSQRFLNSLRGSNHMEILSKRASMQRRPHTTVPPRQHPG